MIFNRSLHLPPIVFCSLVVFTTTLGTLALTQCSTPSSKKNASEDLDITATGDVEMRWKAAWKVALAYPIRDYSKEDGYIESDWIYPHKNSRYRFFIHITEGDPTDITVQSQKRRSHAWGSQKRDWEEDMPSFDIEENLKNNIHARLQELES